MFLTPGELCVGLWVIPEPQQKKKTERNFSSDNNDEADAVVNSMMTVLRMRPEDVMDPVPHLIIAVQLPFIVVADCFSNANATITKIWRTDVKQLREVSKEFVMAYDPKGFTVAEDIVRRTLAASKLKKSSEAA